MARERVRWRAPSNSEFTPLGQVADERSPEESRKPAGGFSRRRLGANSAGMRLRVSAFEFGRDSSPEGPMSDLQYADTSETGCDNLEGSPEFLVG